MSKWFFVLGLLLISLIAVGAVGTRWVGAETTSLSVEDRNLLVSEANWDGNYNLSDVIDDGQYTCLTLKMYSTNKKDTLADSLLCVENAPIGCNNYGKNCKPYPRNKQEIDALLNQQIKEIKENAVKHYKEKKEKKDKIIQQGEILTS